MNEKNTKWKEIFGCTAIYANGHLLIYKDMKAYKMPGGQQQLTWMIMGEREDCLQISMDGFAVSLINKSLCEII